MSRNLKKNKNISRSKRAGLRFSVAFIDNKIRKGNYATRISTITPIYLTAVLEYLTAEILELAGTAAKENQKQRIIPRHIMLAIKNDTEFKTLLQNIIIPQTGAMPNIHHKLRTINIKHHD